MDILTDTDACILERRPAWRALATLDRASNSMESGQVGEALDAVVDSLCEARAMMSEDAWGELASYAREDHELRQAIYEDPLTLRALQKPRGYAGDAVMMDYAYGIHSAHVAATGASPLGRAIYRWVYNTDASAAVRYRREHIARLIDSLAARVSKPGVLAVAAGHLREAELSQALAAGRLGRMVALDADAESLREIETLYAHLGVETVHGSVRHILARKVNLGTFDLVYAAGLYDYLPANVAQALTERMFEMVRPGGDLLVANFAPEIRARLYMESFMDWKLIYRDEHEMAQLVARIDPDAMERCDVYGDPAGSVLYLRVKKAGRMSARHS